MFLQKYIKEIDYAMLASLFFLVFGLVFDIDEMHEVFGIAFIVFTSMHIFQHKSTLFKTKKKSKK